MKIRKRGGILNSLLYILLLPVYLLGKVFPRDPNLFAFGSGHGNFWMDNSKYFFLYCSQNLKSTKCVFFCRDKEVVRQLNQAGYESYYTYSARGIITALRAGKCFISHSTHDINALLIGGAEKIQLWHGTPLKLICYDVLALSTGFGQTLKNRLKRILFTLFPYLNTGLVYDKITISSDFVKASFLSAFRAKNENIVITGQPRNDALSDDYIFDQQLFPEIAHLERLRHEYQHVITWMPTHRLRSGRGTVGLLDNFAFDLESLQQLFQQHGATLVVKVHFLDSPDLKRRFEGCSGIKVYPFADPYPLLRYTDILISDYSSVVFDYLLLDRPIIFTPFDYEEYTQSDAPFYYNYQSVAPGRHCRNWPEVLDALHYHLTCHENGETDSYHERRAAICRQFNMFSDGFSSRVVASIFGR
ncbi:MAG: CDP-glycerol glycerophosphotransferase family protein [Candidatus Zixiibacteriota bacterium]|nr:MAG: CDP-glycerol glycerophosphotransferase family protein [candidate division Zixibacteria bacterium]